MKNNSRGGIIELRNVIEDDLNTFFEFQLDEDANDMAAFTSRNPSDKEAFDAHWEKIMGMDTVIINTIVYNGLVAGSVLKHESFGDPEVSYWIGKEFWGKGIATYALAEFLSIIKIRPIYARVVNDNIGSIRVLEKCGFVKSGTERGFANARGAEVEEYIYKLD